MDINVIIKREDPEAQGEEGVGVGVDGDEDREDGKEGEPGEKDKTNGRWEQVSDYYHQQQQSQSSVEHLESKNCLNTLSSSSSPATPASTTAESTVTSRYVSTIVTTPFIGLSRFDNIATNEKNHFHHQHQHHQHLQHQHQHHQHQHQHQHQRSINDSPYGLVQNYASIVENYPSNCNHRRTNTISSSINSRLTNGISPESLDSASFIKRRNERERARVKNVNEGFDRLRKHLPLTQSQREKRLSKVETLRMAISYIKHLELILKLNKSKPER